MMNISKLITSFINMQGEGSNGAESTLFTDLTPVDNADPDGSYAKALSFAFQNDKIKNIAITGPYGSGKSSVIRTFEKNSHYKFLNISLASFKEISNNQIVPIAPVAPTESTLIERSILQQMLYGADASKLPYSRFKRIATPDKSLLKSLLLVTWLIDSILLYHHQNEILNIEYLSLLWLGAIFLISFVLAIPVVLVSDIYKNSFGLSFKKISLKNAEIEASELPENSILNRHLDEIIYFFQATDYDAVVIEDLDRFGDPEIFVKLREINKLINDNEKTSGKIKFVYAIKDDMFAHKNRAKFFDFIVPVVPIINSSNSLDKMQERLNKYDFAQSVGTQFLREVSLYIDDLRLIHNIFNELVIYFERLKSESLDVEKLLAMIIYKNVYPDDFECLHHGKGALFDICKKRPEFQIQNKKRLEEKISNLRKSIELAKSEKARSIEELISIYVGHLVRYASQPVLGLVVNGQQIRFPQLVTFEKFEPLISTVNIQLVVQQAGYGVSHLAINRSFQQIEEEINPGATFLSRKESIENKSTQQYARLQLEIKDVEREISELPQLQLFQILLSSNIDIHELINGNNISESGLLGYLVGNGYLDDNYHLYISNFHEGRLTKNDRDYLLTIRNFKQPDPYQKVDTQNEVFANMREEDFGQKYVLNVILIDHLLGNKEIYSKRLKQVMGYISQNFKQSEEFLTAYFIAGNQIDEFVRNLCQEWHDVVREVMFSGHGSELIAYIIKFVDAEFICLNLNAGGVLTKYLSENARDVFASDFELPESYDILEKLNVRFQDLEALENNHDLLEFAHLKCLYVINVHNVNYVLRMFAEPQSDHGMSPIRANYTSILTLGSAPFKQYIEENLPAYIEKVLLSIPENSEESGAAIKALINNENVDEGQKKQILSKQVFVFESFNGIPEGLWSFLLLEEKISLSWANFSEYLARNIEDNDSAILTEILGHTHVVDMLSSSKISKEEIGAEAALAVDRFIFSNDGIEDSSYCKLIKCLAHKFQNFPDEISEEKAECLAREKVVGLNEDSFGFAVDSVKLTTILISKSFNIYLEGIEKFPINDDVRELLLSSEIGDDHKIIMGVNIKPSKVQESKELSRAIANLLVSNEFDCANVDETILSSAIVNAETISDSIKLLIRSIPSWGEKETMEVLSKLPEPYSEISAYGKRPKLVISDENLSFVRLLKTRDFISSFKNEDDSIKINTFKSVDHTEA